MPAPTFSLNRHSSPQGYSGRQVYQLLHACNQLGQAPPELFRAAAQQLQAQMPALGAAPDAAQQGQEAASSSEGDASSSTSTSSSGSSGGSWTFEQATEIAMELAAAQLLSLQLADEVAAAAARQGGGLGLRRAAMLLRALARHDQHASLLAQPGARDLAAVAAAQLRATGGAEGLQAMPVGALAVALVRAGKAGPIGPDVPDLLERLCARAQQLAGAQGVGPAAAGDLLAALREQGVAAQHQQLCEALAAAAAGEASASGAGAGGEAPPGAAAAAAAVGS